MLAALLEEVPSRSLTVADIDAPSLRSGEVRISVEVCGICGTDIHILDGDSYAPETPFVMGHEPAGIVVEVADDGDTSWIGRRVVPHLFVGCGVCEWCRAGDERLCASAAVIGVAGHWGGFAEQLLIPASHCVPVPNELGAPAAASLVDSGATAYNALRAGLRMTGGLPSGEVVVVGGGPVGQLVAELARLGDAPVQVVESNAARRAALDATDHRTVPTLEDVENVAVVIDCSGDPTILPWSLKILRPRGVFVVVGYSPVPTFDSTLVSRRELQVGGVRSGSREDLVHVLDVAARGSINLPPVSVWPLPEINEAFSALRNRAVSGKALIRVSDNF